MNAHIDRRIGRPRLVNGKERPGRVTYTVRVYVDVAHGGPQRETHGTYKLERAAKAKLVAVLDAYHKGSYTAPSTMTVAEMLRRWLDEYVINLRPLSRKNYRQIVANHIVPVLGDERAATLQPGAVTAWLAELLRDGRRDGRGGMAPKYVRQCRFVLRAAYAYTVKLGELSRNPVDDAPGPPVPQRDTEPPTVARMRLYLQALKGTRYYVPMAIAAATGMRRGEVLGLSWAHVDTKAQVVRVRRQLVDSDAGPALSVPKTAAALRDLHLPTFVCTVLDAERARQQRECLFAGRHWTEDAYVCPGHDGGPIPPDYFSRGFTGALTRRGLPKFRFHDIRHAVATTMLEAGERADVVQRQLGHAQVAITLGIYAHVRPGETSKAMERYGRRWELSTAGTENEPADDAADETRHQPDTNAEPVDELAQRRARRMPA